MCLWHKMKHPADMGTILGSPDQDYSIQTRHILDPVGWQPSYGQHSTIEAGPNLLDMQDMYDTCYYN